MQSAGSAKDEFVGLPEAAERLGVHRATVNDMVRHRRLAARRRGAHWMIRRADLEAFAASYVRPLNAPSRRPSPTLPAKAPEVLASLKDFGSATAGELAPLLDLHEGNVRKHLRLMEHAGLVRRLPTGEWELADSA